MNKNIKVIETENLEDALKLFVDAYNGMSPGDEVTLTIKAPPKKSVKLCRVIGPEGHYLFNLINKNLSLKNISKAGYVSMDSNYNWYYSVELPKQNLEAGVHVTNGDHIFLFHYEIENLEYTWDKMIKYVS